MKSILLSLFLFCVVLAASAQRLPILPDITALKAFTGAQSEVLVVDVSTGGKFATSTSINAETADEFDIYAGAGGRKWKRVSKIGPPDTLYTESPIAVKPRGTGRRIDTVYIKMAYTSYSPSVTGSGPNVDGVTASGFNYTRIDTVVEVSGRLTVDLAGVFSGGLIPINIPLPVSSTFANVYDITGEVNAVSNSASNNAAGWVEADVANSRAKASIYLPSGSSDPRDLIIRFKYIIH